MNKVVFLVVFGSLISACMAQNTMLTKKGEAIKVVSKKEREEVCQFVSVVTDERHWSVGGVEAAMNTVRNKASEMGANGINIISINTGGMNNDTHMVTAEALKCAY